MYVCVYMVIGTRNPFPTPPLFFFFQLSVQTLAQLSNNKTTPVIPIKISPRGH
jgi:hypothetical protein